MKQVAQRLKDGVVEVLDVPLPSLQPEGVLVDVRASVLSGGTERNKVETGRKSLLGKARSRPDQVRQVVEKAKRDGLRDTVAAVRRRLETPEPLGYSASGVVVGVGKLVPDLAVGDRVACAGAGYASHADVDYVPGNLCVRLPDEVDFGQGAFTTLGAIALQGVRQADVRLGERVAVIGLGLIGQLAGQLLRANGCRVVGNDLRDELIETALEGGAIDSGLTADQVADSAEFGSFDAVILTAATPSNEPVELAAQLCRDRGRVVVLGDVGLEIPRAPYYEKELDLRLSRSYGPGRYDREYEERGLDYPIGYVRWTERRNMSAFVELVAGGRVDVRPLLREEIPIERASEAYERLLSGGESPLGVLITYGELRQAETPTRLTSAPDGPSSRPGRLRDPLVTGVIGAGSFATKTLIPALSKSGFSLAAVSSASGLTARSAADRFGFSRADSTEAILADPDIGLVAIATRHSTHAELAERALKASKAVFVEKPPCLTREELRRLTDARAESGERLFVGFNRRHAPLTGRLREEIADRTGPLELIIRVNAGRLEHDHWLNDPTGGGRLLGEGCHFVDLACWLAGTLPVQVSCILPRDETGPLAMSQRFSIALNFADGSTASIAYGSEGSSSLGKEYIEAHWGGCSATLDDFRSFRLSGKRPSGGRRGGRQDKGHLAQAAQIRDLLSVPDAVVAGPDPLETMGATLAALQSGETGQTVVVESFRHDQK